ncbi:MAG: hypothetical protein ABIH80_01205 [Methanobacteriota archaeon]
MGGLDDGGREGGFNFGGSYGLKALHFENQKPQMISDFSSGSEPISIRMSYQRRFFPENSKEGLLSIRTYIQNKEMD